MKFPAVSFECVKQGEPIYSQTVNLGSKWDDVGEQVFEEIHYYVNLRWQIDKILVRTKQLVLKGSRDTPYTCHGEVSPDKPQTVLLSIGKKVKGGGSKVMGVLIHELIHSIVMSSPDYRFNKPGKLEDRIFDELATDLLAQHVLHRIFHARIRTVSSVRYALDENARNIVLDKEYKSERDEIIKRVNRAIREYLKTRKNYFSLRRDLMQV